MSSEFSAPTPYDICEMYAVGKLSREKLVDELTRFPYIPGGHTDGYDSLLVDLPGTWSEVADACRRGLIDESIYADVFTARHPEASPATE